MAERGGCFCDRCTQRIDSYGDNEGHSDWHGLYESTVVRQEVGETNTEPPRSVECESERLQDENTQPVAHPRHFTFASLTRKLSRRKSTSRSGRDLSEGEGLSEGRPRKQRCSEKRKSWSGFLRPARTEEPELTRQDSRNTRSRRSSWYDKFRRVLDFKLNDEGEPEVAENREEPFPRTRSDVPREPFRFPLSVEEFESLRRERFRERPHRIKMEYFLVPDLLAVTNCPWYWGKINRYQAETVSQGRETVTLYRILQVFLIEVIKIASAKLAL